MSKKLFEVVAFTVATLLMTGTGAWATFLTVADTDLLGAGSPITYTLDFSATSATFTIQTPADPGGAEWYAGWFLFKLYDGNNPADITNLVPPSGTWTVSDGNTNPNVQVLKAGSYPSFGALRNDGFSGFYLANLDNSTSGDEVPSQGIHLTDGINTYSFTFDFASTGGNLNTDAVNFKVGYYDGFVYGGNPPVIKNINTSQLSTYLVPEPGTLILLGSGLVGVVAFGRRLRKRG